MFDLSFSEIVIVGVAALVVLGPEKLPEVARTAGRWLARAQSYLIQVKGEIERETQLSEIKRIREEISNSAADLKKSFTDIETGVKAETEVIRETVSTVKDSVNSITKNTTPDPYTQFNQAEATLLKKSSTSDFRTNNPFGWDMGTDEGARQSRYVPKRYKPTASLDDLIEEVESLRREMALPKKSLGGYNRRYAPRARVNRPRIYR
ncbi:MAG: Sec-independent protein translocase protein TatB [Candidatus Aphodousia sp.]|nr:Sec-independent protein translocase protein TatB [Sutterella sp.]MDY2900114.1 Sec-independent protein translocase protein TatB [Candidatus Aphodousia sp.]